VERWTRPRKAWDPCAARGRPKEKPKTKNGFLASLAFPFRANDARVFCTRTSDAARHAFSFLFPPPPSLSLSATNKHKREREREGERERESDGRRRTREGEDHDGCVDHEDFARRGRTQAGATPVAQRKNAKLGKISSFLSFRFLFGISMALRVVEEVDKEEGDGWNVFRRSRA